MVSNYMFIHLLDNLHYMVFAMKIFVRFMKFKCIYYLLFNKMGCKLHITTEGSPALVKDSYDN
jgi:hypothetical protein